MLYFYLADVYRPLNSINRLFIEFIGIGRDVAYVNHEFTIAVITVIFALCRDFRQLPSFCVTAVIITKICTISTSKRSILSKYL